MLSVIDGSVPNGQAATCWIATAGEKYAFTANPGANSISSYRDKPGKTGLTLVAGAAAVAARPLDIAVTENRRFLYALDPGLNGIDAYRIEADGTLTDLGPVPAGLAIYAQGLVAR